MPSPSVETVDLLDLKMLPAWVKEPSEGKSYADYEGDAQEERTRGRDRGPHRGRDRSRQRPTSKADRTDRGQSRTKRHGRDQDRRRGEGRPTPDRHQDFATRRPLEITVRFLPHLAALENVAAQIKSGSVAYSLFSIARLFLEKPERYDVHLTAKSESPLYQLGEQGAISADRDFLESNAFRLAKENFYKIEVTQGEPIKGNFSTVARCGLSGTLLGPTNHHNYQPRLRTLYEQRFSRRMSFPEYQRKIEMVSDPDVLEKWKEEARNVTTFTTRDGEAPSTFTSEAETERHFRQNYLPGLVRTLEESTIDGVTSRRLPDRALHRLVENAWAAETRSPSNMMQELSKQFREAGLQIFRHRRGMLFVSPIRVRAFRHDETGVSAPIKGIREALATNPGINRKELAEKVIGSAASAETTSEEAEARKLALASDLHWLISEGYVIEFNDGSLDLPRVKTKSAESPGAQPDVTAQGQGQAPATPSSTGSKDVAPATSEQIEHAAATAPASTIASSGAEIGGS